MEKKLETQSHTQRCAVYTQGFVEVHSCVHRNKRKQPETWNHVFSFWLLSFLTWLNLTQVSQLRGHDVCCLKCLCQRVCDWPGKKSLSRVSCWAWIVTLLRKTQEVKWFAIWHYITAWKVEVTKEASTPSLRQHFLSLIKYLQIHCRTMCSEISTFMFTTSSNSDLLNTNFTPSVSSRQHNQPTPSCLILFAEYLLISTSIGSRGRLIRQMFASKDIRLGMWILWLVMLMFSMLNVSSRLFFFF